MVKVLFKFASSFEGDCNIQIKKWLKGVPNETFEISGSGRELLVSLPSVTLESIRTKISSMPGLYYAIAPPEKGNHRARVYGGSMFVKQNWLDEQFPGRNLLLSSLPSELSG